MPAITGTQGNDRLTGTGDDDQISGLEGDDAIVSGAGNDTIDGGAGQDTIDGGEGDDILLGGDGWDVIVDGAGSDTVNGGSGADTIRASLGWGSDSYDGGSNEYGFDAVDYGAAVAGMIVDLSAAFDHARSATQVDAGMGSDQLRNIEAVIGSAYDDLLTGNSGDNRLVGGRGNDILTGGDGSDVLVDQGGTVATVNGGHGNDSITVELTSLTAGDRSVVLGGDGSDSLTLRLTGPGSALVDMGAGGDMLHLGATPTGGLTITLGDPGGQSQEAIHFILDDMWQSAGAIGPITITDFGAGRYGDFIGLRELSIGLLKGAGWDGRISPFEAGLMRLAQAGADTVLQVDRQGNGTFADLIIFQNTVASTFDAHNFFGPTEIAAQWGLPAAGQTLFGDSGDNRITGSAGADIIDGRAGDDVIDGARGNDLLTGGAGRDTFVASRATVYPQDRAGRDTITDFDTSQDRLDLGQYGFRWFADVLSRAQQSGVDVIIRLGPLESVTLRNMQLASLTPSNFVGLLPGSGLAVLPPPEPASTTVDFYSESVGMLAVEAGTTLFGRLANGIVQEDPYEGQLTGLVNRGTIWASGDGAARAIAGYALDTVTNIGRIYSVASDGDAWAIQMEWGVGLLQNSGVLAVVSWRSTAIGVETFNNRSAIVNSGTISARGDYDAIAVAYYNGLSGSGIVNEQAGRILAEGPGAAAIYIGGADIYNQTPVAVRNAGLIEASTTSDDPSVAIYFGGPYTGGTATVVNTGVIRADIAFYAAQLFTSARADITNEIGALISGAMIFAERDDSVLNRGLIEGNLFTEAGDDLVDTSAGRLNGYVDLGAGNDRYLGSGFADDVSGGDGNDELRGNKGDDILTGGAGDDLIDGGDGYDVLTYDDAAAGVTVNLGTQAAQNTGGGGVDTLFNIEDVTGTRFGDMLTGSSTGNVLLALAGDDILVGAGGVDLLDGGEGSDIYVMRSFDDHLAAEIDDTGAAGTDEIRFAADTAGLLTLYAADLGIERVVMGTGTGATAVTSGTTGLGVDARLVANALTIIGNDGANLLQGTVFGDFLQGGGGNDTLSGGNGNDVLIGGAGADSLSGEGGDDRIVFDLADFPTSITGGAGHDVLIGDNMAAPVAFNLAAQGFEAAEITQYDFGANPWRAVVQLFDAGWAMTGQTTLNDDGSRLVIELDPSNRLTTNQVWNSFDTQGRLSFVDQLFDNGARTHINVDETNSASWAHDWFTYDPQGRLDSEDVHYDNGARTFINFDQANTHGWTQDWFTYDAQGRLDSEDVHYDNGTRTFVNLDQDNSQSWSQAWFTYDAQGRLDTQDVHYDDGTRLFTNYDQAGTEAFSTRAIFYGADGQAAQYLTVWDDGSRSYDRF